MALKISFAVVCCQRKSSSVILATTAASMAKIHRAVVTSISMLPTFHGRRMEAGGCKEIVASLPPVVALRLKIGSFNPE